MDSPDNSRLENHIRIVTQSPHNTQTTQEFLNLVKDSRLIMLVLESDGPFEIDEIRFDINYIKLGADIQAVALFTGWGLMEKSGLRSSSITLDMYDLVEILSEVPGKYPVLAINAVTDLSINISTDEFLDLF